MPYDHHKRKPSIKLTAAEVSTYRNDFPVFAGATSNVEVAAYTILVVEGARLDVSCAHQIEARVRRFVRIKHLQVVPTDS